MEWDEYYKKFDEWATSTQISRLSALTSYGPSDEVAEVAQGLMDETAASRLIRRALAAGVQFTAEEICELVNCCNAAVMNALLENSTCAFTREQLEDLWGVVDDALLEQTARRCRVKLFDDDEEEEEEEDDEPEAEDDADDNADVASEPYYEVACPACGETVYVSEDDLDAGEAICPSCKVAFEVALADDEEPEEDDGPVQYEVTCPACGATAVFEEADLLDGEPTCPNCGKPLDFEVTEE